MTVTITIDLSTREGLAYLEALADEAIRLSSRNDLPDPLTDFWRDAVKKLIAKVRADRDLGRAAMLDRLSSLCARPINGFGDLSSMEIEAVLRDAWE